jgi:hypothetical protein
MQRDVVDPAFMHIKIQPDHLIIAENDSISHKIQQKKPVNKKCHSIIETLIKSHINQAT